ncbi:uncharacterized protein LOC134187066 [Corticium candelabrum]|uniref:uncharacterized protein LOC134187066 n=1 Tax=Corticium candelabrum TaxID=121492 RepID=UPI002E275E5F|nr:uncharacterized protein LOC134187066 [Corticium candelabrum]
MYTRNEALGIHSNNFCESEINDIRCWLAHRLITQFAANTTGNKSLNLEITPTNIQPSAKYYISWETTEIVTETLESELYDYPLLRLLQTWQSLQAWRAEHDDDTPLQEQTVSVGACWLSIHLHVALWLDDKCFNNKPAVQVVGDFVLATHELHMEFINFVSDNTMPDIYLVPAVSLVRFWIR